MLFYGLKKLVALCASYPILVDASLGEHDRNCEERTTLTYSVSINSTPRQTITSFGASGAWWPNDLIHFPPQVQAQLGNLLFSEDGLYLSSYRYNMGGDGGQDARVVTSFQNTVESFLTTNGTYDWNRDHAGVTFLKMAQAYDVPYITFFINAAPAAIADNKAACDWNLTAAKVPAFADYIATVLSHWTDAGIPIKYISPMNEPDNNRSDCGQEGMAVSPSLRPSAFQAIREALNSSPPAAKIGIIGDETSQITTQAFPEYPVWLAPAAPSLDSIAVHNYDFPSDSSLATYRMLINNLTSSAHEAAPPVKFTETCCSTTAGTGSSVFGAQYDPTMTNALIVARYVWQFLTIVNAESFDWWTAITNLPCSPTLQNTTYHCDPTAINETAGYNSGLIYIDGQYNQTRDYTLYLTKRAWALKHFSYFHRPGSVRFDVDGDLPEGVVALATRSHSNGTRTAPHRRESRSLRDKVRRGESGLENQGQGQGQSQSQQYTILFLNNATTPSPQIDFKIPASSTASGHGISTTNTNGQGPGYGNGQPLRLLSITETSPSADWKNVEVTSAVQMGNGGGHQQQQQQEEGGEYVSFTLPAQSMWTLRFG